MKGQGQISKVLSNWKWRILLAYVLVLLASHLVRWSNKPEVVPPGLQAVTVSAVQGDRTTTQQISLAYKEYKSADSPDKSVVVLIQGSPGSHRDFQSFAPVLARQHRVIVPDLPGFGASTQRIPDYSNRAHARYLLDLLDQLNVPRAHFVGYSMGGGVVLHLADLAPERVASLTMLSAIGIQELELLGSYHLNHAIHGAQLALFWSLHELIPHFGWFDHSPLNRAYARNFYDTDQRSLRSVLTSYAGPMLIVHGEQDVMVPVEVARENYRLVPQSELVIFPDGNHFYVFADSLREASATLDFLNRVESGNVQTRNTAEPQRLAVAAGAVSSFKTPRAMGPTALVLFALLALSTLVSEDLTCIWAGVLAAEGRLSFSLAVAACLFGIFVGDLLLFLAGRVIGRTALRRAPLKWFVREADIQRSSAWFERRGMAAIALSRFVPGTRLPTYVAAGLLNTSLVKFSFYFLIAAAIWTPLLVGAAMLAGRGAIESSLIVEEYLLLSLALTAIVLFICVRVLLRLLTFRSRRHLVARWRRLTQWEFWPPWAFYPPVVLYIIFLGLKYRCLTLFTCANPAIEDGGFIGESKSAILFRLGKAAESRQFIARLALLEQSLSFEKKLERALAFMQQNSLAYPVVLKPDAGERGSGVSIVRSNRELEDYLLASGRTNVIIQEYAAGFEFGVFCYRFSQADRAQIFSITRKVFPSVVGDGQSSLEELILKDKRAVCMSRAYFAAQRERLWEVPAPNTLVQLIEIGTHCRGCIFLDGDEVRSSELEAAIDKLAKTFAGFHFGRFDIRTQSLEDFQQGKNFKVVELNGVTSEATSIYDPKNSLFDAYRILFRQWRLAFEIGQENRKLGAKPSTITRLGRLTFEKWRRAGERSEAEPRPINEAVESASQLPSEV